MYKLDLGGIWSMKKTSDTRWMEGRVPGSVFKDLLDNGIIEDPFYRDNEDKAKEIASYDYVYEREFDIGAEALGLDKLNLCCKGLDTFAEIRLNGNVVGKADNMHRTYEFDIKKLVKAGSNNISIIIYSPLEFISRKHEEFPVYHATGSMPGNPYIRKAHCMFGWDWGPQIPDCGIWRDIYIAGYDTARLEDVYISQTHEGGRVTLDVRVRTERWNDSDIGIEAVLTTASGEKAGSSGVSAAGREDNITIVVENPDLWWPNGYGRQPLYNLSVDLKKGGELLDCMEFRIGLRGLRVKREKDEWGESFEFEINGASIFAMGADYIPEDNLLSRCSPERTEKLIKDCVSANFNCIRVWGGGIYPEDWFYDLCDRYGLIVWQDLMYACAVYELTPDFEENIGREVEDNMKRLRHHACLGIWCGNNEMEWGWNEWAFEKPPRLRTDYIKQFEILFPRIAKETDPNTLYWPSSPSSGGGFDAPNDDNRGDVHYWEVWHHLVPFTEYRKHYFRFCSEFGFQSFPSLKTVESFTLPEDRNVFSRIMEKHQKNGSANSRILFYLADNFKYPKDLDSLIYASQILQAEAIRYGVEHWRRNRGRCMGAIYWQLNDCWPVASWSSIDSFGRWKALHYHARKFFAPALLSAREEGTGAELHVSNESMEKLVGQVSWKLRDRKSAVLSEGSELAEVGPLSSKLVTRLDFSGILSQKDLVYKAYLEYSLIADGKCMSEGTVLFTRPKYFEFEDPKLETRVTDKGDKYEIAISSDSYAKYVELDLDKADCVFSDNYFDLTAGSEKRIEVAKSSITGNIPEDGLKAILKVRSLYDIASERVKTPQQSF